MPAETTDDSSGELRGEGGQWLSDREWEGGAVSGVASGKVAQQVQVWGSGSLEGGAALWRSG